MTQPTPDHPRSAASAAIAGVRGVSIRAMFSRIAGVYDRMNRLLSFGLDRLWRRNLVRRLDGDLWEILDLCTGTADLALECVRRGKGRQIFAADFSQEMLAAAARKAGKMDMKGPADQVFGARASRPIHFAAMDAARLPLPDAAVDAVIVGFGVRNFTDLDQGIAEITRVLRPAGQLVVLDFFGDETSGTGVPCEPKDAAACRGPNRPVRWLLSHIVPQMGRIVARDQAAYRYLSNTMRSFISPCEFCVLLRAAGYEEIFVVRQTLGIAHIVGGRRPT